jgi:hypothetical protein
LGIPISQLIFTSIKEKKTFVPWINIVYKLFKLQIYINNSKDKKVFFNGIASEILAFGVVLNGDRTVCFLAITLCCPQEAEVLSHLTPNFANQIIRPNQQRKLQKIHKVL